MSLKLRMAVRLQFRVREPELWTKLNAGSVFDAFLTF